MAKNQIRKDCTRKDGIRIELDRKQLLGFDQLPPAVDGDRTPLAKVGASKVGAVDASLGLFSKVGIIKQV